jgi:16S rRNA (adenine1518-N6/adenine1519-N6)-dimethyltransferase
MDLTKPSELSRLLKAHGLHLTKRLGQNFLVDRTHLLRVVDTAGVNEEDRVFEIGPGAGTLTIELAQRAKRLVTVELDRGLLPVLADVLAPFSNATVVHADALRLDLPVFLSEHLEASSRMPVKVVANIPYNITSPLLARLLENKELFTSITLMVQKEVARRLAAPPGTADYGSFSVFAQFHAHVSVAGIVPRGAFFPPPQVDSAVVHLVPRAVPPVAVPSEAAFFLVSRAAFGQRRKTLTNALANDPALNAKGFDRAAIEKAVTATGIDGQRRGETLSLDELAAISRALFSVPPFADA